MSERLKPNKKWREVTSVFRTQALLYSAHGKLCKCTKNFVQTDFIGRSHCRSTNRLFRKLKYNKLQKLVSNTYSYVKYRTMFIYQQVF